ncbi:MAG: hypothetical protein LBR53_12485 [Deltaproteobacteria bacterium]|jgi:hypothetical protein|nr:hypothetical protein [Deltaproteobacteria bacterium]
MFRSGLKIFLFVFFLFFVSCGSDPNPFLGEWELDLAASRESLESGLGGMVPNELNMKIKFDENTFFLYMDDEKVEEKKIIYKKIDNATWNTCLPDGTDCDVVRFTDDRTMRFQIQENVFIVMKKI